MLWRKIRDSCDFIGRFRHTGFSATQGRTLGFVMLQLMERGSRRRERPALEYPDKWSPQADKFLQLKASNSARELHLVN
jgi:hypothetical protein